MNARKIGFLLVPIFLLLYVGIAFGGAYSNPMVIPNEFGIGLGVEYDLMTRTVEVGDDDIKGNILANRLFVNLALAPVSFFRVRGKAGIGNITLADFGTSETVDDGRGGFDEFSSPVNFAGGADVAFAIMKDPNKYVGIGVTGHVLYQMASEDEINVSFIEYGGGIAFGLISLGTIVPYAGFGYTGLTGEVENEDIEGDEATEGFRNDPDNPVGIFGGFNVIIGDNLRLELEGRFLNELSGMTSILFYF